MEKAEAATFFRGEHKYYKAFMQPKVPEACKLAADAIEAVERLESDRNALAADNARLRKALELWQRITFAFEEFGDRGELVVFSPVYYHNSMSVTRDALAANPAQSLAAHDAALLRRLAARSEPGERADIAPWLLDIADRIERGEK